MPSNTFQPTFLARGAAVTVLFHEVLEQLQQNKQTSLHRSIGTDRSSHAPGHRYSHLASRSASREHTHDQQRQEQRKGETRCEAYCLIRKLSLGSSEAGKRAEDLVIAPLNPRDQGQRNRCTSTNRPCPGMTKLYDSQLLVKHD